MAAQNRICSFDGCTEQHYAKGFCQKHYARWKSHGDPSVVRKKSDKSIRASIEDLSVPEPNTGCWLWIGCVGDTGYPSISRKKLGGRKNAHRVSYEEYKGKIPEGMVVCHSCDTKICVNPDHLWIGTQAQNLADCQEKGRNARGERQHLTTLADSDIPRIRRLVREGRSQSSVSREYGVSITAVHNIVKMKTWRHIA